MKKKVKEKDVISESQAEEQINDW